MRVLHHKILCYFGVYVQASFDVIFFWFFLVGSSMQDFSKDVDYNFLNGACDKDSSLAANESALERIKLAKTPDLIEAPESIKLEDSSIYSWHTSTTNIGSNFL